MLDNLRARVPANHSFILTAEYNLADSYHSMGRFAEAEALYCSVLEKTQGLALERISNTMLLAMENLDRLYAKQDRVSQALPLLHEAALLREARRGNDPENMGHCLLALGRTYFQTRCFDQAATYLAQALVAFDEARSFSQGHAVALSLFGAALAEQGQCGIATDYLRQSVALLGRHQQEGGQNLERAKAYLALCKPNRERAAGTEQMPHETPRD